jgi:hypothetical protein
VRYDSNFEKKVELECFVAETLKINENAWYCNSVGDSVREMSLPKQPPNYVKCVEQFIIFVDCFK